MQPSAQFLQPHPGFFQEPFAVEQWLSDYCEIQGTYLISDDGKVTILGSCSLKNSVKLSCRYLAVEFVSVSETFDCSYSGLRSLVGAPRRVAEDFRCCGCDDLRSLQGGPVSVLGSYSCNGCPLLTSLAHAPTRVDGDFDCYNCISLRTLDGAPRIVGGDFTCNSCPLLKDLQGGPTEVYTNYHCQRCPSLTSLKGAPVKGVLSFHCENCLALESLEGLPQLEEWLHVQPLDFGANDIRYFLLNRHTVKTRQIQYECLAIVNNYHKSGDLLTAIAQFEAYFNEPFNPGVPLAAPAEVTGLSL